MFKVLFLFLMLNIPQLSSKEYVTANLWGQLGNQLFIISNALALAWDHGAIPVFPTLKKDKTLNIPVNYKKIFFRLNTEIPREKFQKRIRFKKKYYTDHFYEEIDYEPNICLVGYSLSLDYFHHYEKRLQKIFAPSEETKEYLISKYGIWLDSPITVGIQIRVCALDLYPFTGWEYFEKAMRLFPENAIFFVSSDRIGWVKKHFPVNGRTIIFLEGNDHVDDFFLLSMCTHNIISNSTFGYWAAYLNPNPDKMVVAPSLWYGPEHELTKIGFPKKQNIYPKNWYILDVPFDRTVSTEALSYPTTSIEGG